MVAAGAAILLLIGLWTPLAAVLIAPAELGLAVLHPAEPWMNVNFAAMGAALAMLDLAAVPWMRASSDASTSRFPNAEARDVLPRAAGAEEPGLEFDDATLRRHRDGVGPIGDV